MPVCRAIIKEPGIDEFTTPITPRKSARQEEKRNKATDDKVSSAASSPSRRKRTTNPMISTENRTNQRQLARRGSTHSNEQNVNTNMHMEEDEREHKLIIVELSSPEKSPNKESPKKELTASEDTPAAPQEDVQLEEIRLIPPATLGNVSDGDNVVEERKPQLERSSASRTPKSKVVEEPKRPDEQLSVEAGHSILFSQVIRALELEQITPLIERSDNNMMVATIKGLPSVDALPFLQLVDRTLRQQQKDKKGIPNWLNWIRWVNNVLQIHANHLSTIPNLESHFALLAEWMEGRTQNMDKLLQLQGKLRFLAGLAPKNIQQLRNQKPMAVFDFDKNAIEKKRARQEIKQHFAQKQAKQSEANKTVDVVKVEYADEEDEEMLLGESDRMNVGGVDDGAC